MPKQNDFLYRLSTSFLLQLLHLFMLNVIIMAHSKWNPKFEIS